MKDVKSIVEDVAEIYITSVEDAEKYLYKARGLQKRFGSGTAVVYCWFYSVPQKWVKFEPKIFELMKKTGSFDLEMISLMSTDRIASLLKPMIFYNQISLQLKNFCSAVKNRYSSWNDLVEALKHQNIFRVFETLRKYTNIRVTFKNLAAMKSFIGMNNDFLILDTHVANVLGIRRNEVNKYRTRMSFFRDLLEIASEVNNELRKKGFSDVSTIKWSLAIWFNKSKIGADDLLLVRN